MLFFWVHPLLLLKKTDGLFYFHGFPPDNGFDVLSVSIEPS